MSRQIQSYCDGATSSYCVYDSGEKILWCMVFLWVSDPVVRASQKRISSTRVGIESTTFGLLVRCSYNKAMSVRVSDIWELHLVNSISVCLTVVMIVCIWLHVNIVMMLYTRSYCRDVVILNRFLLIIFYFSSPPYKNNVILHCTLIPITHALLTCPLF